MQQLKRTYAGRKRGRGPGTARTPPRRKVSNGWAALMIPRRAVPFESPSFKGQITTNVPNREVLAGDDEEAELRKLLDLDVPSDAPPLNSGKNDPTEQHDSEGEEKGSGSSPRPQKRRCRKVARRKSKRTSIFKGFCFVFTGFSAKENDKVSQVVCLIKRHGGICLESVSDAIHNEKLIVVSGSPKRTLKSLFTIARGLLPSKISWVKRCVDAGSVLPMNANDVHQVPGCSDEFLLSCLDRNGLVPLIGQNRVFCGARMALNDGAEDFEPILTDAGARILDVNELEAKNDGVRSYLITESTGRKLKQLQKKFCNQTWKVLPRTWLVDALVRGKIEEFQGLE